MLAHAGSRQSTAPFLSSSIPLSQIVSLPCGPHENSAAAVRPAVSFLMRMKQAGIAVLLIHHTNKGGENYRAAHAIILKIHDKHKGIVDLEVLPTGAQSYAVKSAVHSNSKATGTWHFID